MCLRARTRRHLAACSNSRAEAYASPDSRSSTLWESGGRRRGGGSSRTGRARRRGWRGGSVGPSRGAPLGLDTTPIKIWLDREYSGRFSRICISGIAITAERSPPHFWNERRHRESLSDTLKIFKRLPSYGIDTAGFLPRRVELDIHWWLGTQVRYGTGTVHAIDTVSIQYHRAPLYWSCATMAAGNDNTVTARSLGVMFEPPTLTLVYSVEGKLRKRTMPVRHLRGDSDPRKVAQALSAAHPSLLAPHVVSPVQLERLLAKLVKHVATRSVHSDSVLTDLAPVPSLPPAPANGLLPKPFSPASNLPSDSNCKSSPAGPALVGAAHSAAAPTALEDDVDALLDEIMDETPVSRSSESTQAPKLGSSASPSTRPLPAASDACSASCTTTKLASDADRVVAHLAGDGGDLNRVSETELQTAKQAMDATFEANRLKPGDAGYVHDKRLEPPTELEANEWDDEIEDFETDDEDPLRAALLGL